MAETKKIAEFILFDEFKKMNINNPGKLIPINLFMLTEADGAEVFPFWEESSYHKDERYYCTPTNKGISQFSKLI